MPGFNGFVVSDWASIAEMIAHGFMQTEQDAANNYCRIRYGWHGSHIYVTKLVSLVKGLVKESVIDDATQNFTRKI
jgi:beta-glucosidase